MLTHQTSIIRLNIAQLIQQQKGIRPARILTQSFDQLGFDLIDLIDIILAVEQKFQVIIPDEVPLNSINDFVSFIKNKEKNALEIVS